MNEQIYLIIAGSLVLILTWTGIMTRSRRAQFFIRIMGETGTKIFYSIIAIAIIIISFFI